MEHLCPNGPELPDHSGHPRSVFNNTTSEFHKVIFVHPLLVWRFQLHAFRTFLMEQLHRLALINKSEETAPCAHPSYFFFLSCLYDQSTNTPQCHTTKIPHTLITSCPGALMIVTAFPTDISRTSYLLKYHKRKLQTWISVKSGQKKSLQCRISTEKIIDFIQSRLLSTQCCCR